MEVSYVLKIDDYDALQRYGIRYSPQKRAVRLVRWILFPVVIIFVGVLELPAILHAQWDEFDPGFVCLVLALILLLFFWPRILVWRIRKSLSTRDKLKLLSPRKLTLTPHALDYASDHATSSTRWSAIDSIVCTSDHAFIFPSSNFAHIIPRRAFASEEAFDDFVETAKEYQEDALEEESRSGSGSSGRRASSEWKAKTEESFRPLEFDKRLRARRTSENPDSPEKGQRAIPEE